MSETAVEVLRHGADCECTRCTGFPKGHRLGVRHSAFLSRLRPEEAAEIAALADKIRELVPDPFDADEFAIVALARTEWRIERMTAWIAEHGFVYENEARSLLKHVDSAERLAKDLRARLGLDAAARHDLGLKDAQRRALRARTFDLSRLTPEARVKAQQLAQELEDLIKEAEVVEGE